MHVSEIAKTVNQIHILFQVLQDRVDSLQRQIQDLETKTQSLQLTIDRLSLALAKSEEEESTVKDKVLLNFLMQRSNVGKSFYVVPHVSHILHEFVSAKLISLCKSFSNKSISPNF